ncbi:MAG: alpha/beta hydrolase-fold protein [Planctomycetota bacterium]
MSRRHEMIECEAMGRRVHVWCYGHFGPPVIAFPTAAGFAHEWERQSMVTALAHLIGSGRMKLYCPESNVSQSWTHKTDHPSVRAQRHQQYERFVVETLVPFIRQDCASAEIPMHAVGASVGGYFAANFALKYPETFRYALCLSGRYDITNFTEGFSNDDVYFNNPLAYLPSLEGEALDRVRNHTHLSLVCGQGPYEEGCIEETIALANVCESKGIPHTRDIWGRDSAHDWGWWKKQTLMHLGHQLGEK